MTTYEMPVVPAGTTKNPAPGELRFFKTKDKSKDSRESSSKTVEIYTTENLFRHYSNAGPVLTYNWYFISLALLLLLAVGLGGAISSTLDNNLTGVLGGITAGLLVLSPGLIIASYLEKERRRVTLENFKPQKLTPTMKFNYTDSEFLTYPEKVYVQYIRERTCDENNWAESQDITPDLAVLRTLSSYHISFSKLRETGVSMDLEGKRHMEMLIDKAKEETEYLARKLRNPIPKPIQGFSSSARQKALEALSEKKEDTSVHANPDLHRLEIIEDKRN